MIWLLNPPRRVELAPYAAWIGPGFIALGVPIVATAIGFLRRRRWAWWLALVMLFGNMFGDLAQLVMGRVFEGLFGVAAVGLVLVYLTRRRVRASFA